MISIQKIYEKTFGQKYVRALILTFAVLAFVVFPLYAIFVSPKALCDLFFGGLAVIYILELMRNGLFSSGLLLVTVVGLPIFIFRNRRQILSRVTFLNSFTFLVIAFTITGFLWHKIETGLQLPFLGL